jgi:predicted Zn-dependent protease
VIRAARRLAETAETEPELTLLLIEAQLRSRQFGEARQSSFQVLRQHGDRAMYASVLSKWARWPAPHHAEDARTLARNARSLDQRLAIAAYFNRVGKPRDALQLAARHAGPSVNAANAEANAIVADARYRLGDTAAASRRFNAVLAFDPGNATALRGRAELRLSARNPQGAIMDAQKLVSVSPMSGEDRLLLARAYRAAGDTRQEQRVLWQAFRDISADEQIYAALAAPRRRNPDAFHALKDEFARQRDAKINQGYI